MKRKLNHYMLDFWRSTLSKDVIIKSNGEILGIRSRIEVPKFGNKFNIFKGKCFFVRLTNGDMFYTNDLINKGTVPQELQEEFPCNIEVMEPVALIENVV